jgi:hypothetical protein
MPEALSGSKPDAEAKSQQLTANGLKLEASSLQLKNKHCQF